MTRFLFRLGLSLICILPAWAQTPSHPTATVSALQKPASPPVHPPTITPAEWQELRTAHEVALKAHPELMANAVQLSKDMRAFITKLDAAIVKTDPNTAPTVERLENGSHGPKMQPLPINGR